MRVTNTGLWDHEYQIERLPVVIYNNLRSANLFPLFIGI